MPKLRRDEMFSNLCFLWIFSSSCLSNGLNHMGWLTLNEASRLFFCLYC